MLESVIAALGMCADGVAEGLYGVRHRFSARAAGIGFVIGAFLVWWYQLVTPTNFTVESITIATRSSQRRPQILYIVALSAIPSIVLGLFGWYSTFVRFLNPSVVAGIIVGVGVILTKVGIEYLGERPITTSTSILAGVIAYALSSDLVPVIIASVIIGSVVDRFLPARLRRWNNAASEEEAAAQDEEATDTNQERPPAGEDDPPEEQEPKFGLILFHWRDILSRPVLFGAFSVFALRTGTVVSYTTVNAEIARRTPHLDGATVAAGVGSLVSALFGGPPLETTPASMAASPMPVFSTVLFMALMALICFFGLVGRLGRYLPLQAVAGFLVVLGLLITIPDNLPQAAMQPVAGGTAIAVTALTNPFYGILAGEVVALLLVLGVHL